MASLAEIRAKLQAQQNKAEKGSGGGGDNASYPFWNIPEGSTAKLRFLPDSDPNNTFFWVERLVIRVPFQGVKGVNNNETIVQVPCMEMYGKPCPIITETRSWWKDPELVDTARKYWKKKSYIFQGFVVEDPLEGKDSPANPIRRFLINPSIFNIIKASLMDPEMEDLPIDFKNGCDFNLIKTKKGQFADYSTSKWARKTRALSAEEQDAVQQFGLHNLKDFLPKEPTTDEVEVIKEMFKASVDGEPYDPARFSEYFRPSGVARGNADADEDLPSARASIQVKVPASAPVVVDDEDEVTVPASTQKLDPLAALKARASSVSTPKVSEDTSSGDGKDPQALLEILRNRAKKA